MLLLLACQPTSIPEKTESVASETTVVALCPEGMSPIPQADPQYCIDTFEVTVEDGQVYSKKGVIPSTEISFDDAKALCEATAIVNGKNEVLGYKHLATASEWEDAGDGQIGAGGSAFPYGDTWDPDQCYSYADPQPYPELQPTGGLESCKSTFGVYDQEGNAWEWTDGNIFADADGALAHFSGLGLNLQAVDGVLIGSGDPSVVQLMIMGTGPISPSFDDKGRLNISSELIAPETHPGYLAAHDDMYAAAWYPFELKADPDDSSRLLLYAYPDNDRQPIPDKRGCAYYVGDDQGCRLQSSVLIHTHDFFGTISFRCASPPLARLSQNPP